MGEVRRLVVGWLHRRRMVVWVFVFSQAMLFLLEPPLLSRMPSRSCHRTCSSPHRPHMHWYSYHAGSCESCQGANINLPIMEGMGDAHAWALLRQCAFPAIQAHAPHVLFVSLGTDGLQGDPTEVREPVTWTLRT